MLPQPQSEASLPQPDCITNFFDKLLISNKSIAKSLYTLPEYLDVHLNKEVMNCLFDITGLFNEIKSEWKELKDKYKICEDETKLAFQEVDVSFQYSCAASVSELSKISSDIENAKSGIGLQMSSEITTFGIQYREDAWSKSQKYFRSLQNVRKSLLNLSHFVTKNCIIYEKATQQIRSVFLSATQQLVSMQSASLSSCKDILDAFLYDIINQNKEVSSTISNIKLSQDYSISSQTHNQKKYNFKSLDEYAELPTPPQTNIIAVIGKLLYMPCTYSENPKYFEKQNVCPLTSLPRADSQNHFFQGTASEWQEILLILTVDGFLHIYPNNTSDKTSDSNNLASVTDIDSSESYDLPTAVEYNINIHLI